MSTLQEQLDALNLLDPSAELDLSGVTGLERTRVPLRITKIEGPVSTNKKNGTQYKVQFLALEPVEGNDKWQVTVSYIVDFPSNPGFAKRNVKEIRALMEAAFGSASGHSINDLVNAEVTGEVYEDNNDFRRVDRFEAVGADGDDTSDALAAVSGI